MGLKEYLDKKNVLGTCPTNAASKTSSSYCLPSNAFGCNGSSELDDDGMTPSQGKRKMWNPLEMPTEARDRLRRLEDIATFFARRPSGVLSDEPYTPSRPTQLAASLGPICAGLAATARVAGGNVAGGAVLWGTPRGNVGRGGNLRRQTRTIGRENTPLLNGGRLGRGRGTNTSLLPAWYPRTPLRDITAVVRAIERRARLREVDDQEPETNQLHDHVSKILLNIANQAAGDSKFLTPQKKLLNLIETVQKEVLEELRKLKSTPIAKQAAREKRVLTLMSMR
ncbi:protein POLYCHOME-like [Rutidosis leptorrhynchoides]|uniref:protein POLYCHOME-like n=1 Tax=Rutidosis leptorrhynchoides TaxID=125765 RepID=UPI003A99E52F